MLLRFRDRIDAGALPVADHPLVDLCLRQRGVTSRTEAHLPLSDLMPPAGMKDVDRAAARLADAIAGDQRILVLGDYDCDGATGTTVSVLGLRSLGATQVEYILPNRVVHGYGLSPAIAEAAAAHRPDIIMTVDNGSSSVAGSRVVAGFKRPCDLVITDHHLPGAEPPVAYATVNPNQAGCDFPSKHLAGVGVAFMVVAATRAELIRRGHFRGTPPSLAPLLDRVALGTVADLVPFDRNNRILVREGLRRIRAAQACSGISALAALAARPLARIDEADIGFAIAPRINAAGRLASMDIGVACLMAEDDVTALQYATELDRANADRRKRQSDASLDAVARVEEEVVGGVDEQALCAASRSWHEGIVGLVASRLVERYQRPAIVFGGAADQGMLKGSCRTIRGLHIKHILDAINAQNPGLIRGFGGHAMAAGLSLEESSFERFREAFQAQVAERVTPEMLSPDIAVDMVNPSAALFNLGSARALAEAGPWGQDFPAPVFAGSFSVASAKTMKDAHVRWYLRPNDADDGSPPIEAVQFNAQGNCMHWANGEFRQPERLDCVFSMDVNHWRGEDRFQLQVQQALDGIHMAPDQSPSSECLSAEAPAP